MQTLEFENRNTRLFSGPHPSRADASRTNGAKSRGPVTAAGKSSASRNATTHGLCARSTLLSGEDADAFDAFAQSIRRDLAPVGLLQLSLCDRAIGLMWKLRRVPAIESAALDAGTQCKLEGMPADGITELSTRLIDVEDKLLLRLQRYETRLERSLITCLRQLRELQAQDTVLRESLGQHLSEMESSNSIEAAGDGSDTETGRESTPALESADVALRSPPPVEFSTDVKPACHAPVVTRAAAQNSRAADPSPGTDAPGNDIDPTTMGESSRPGENPETRDSLGSFCIPEIDRLSAKNSRDADTDRGAAMGST